MILEIQLNTNIQFISFKLVTNSSIKENNNRLKTKVFRSFHSQNTENRYQLPLSHMLYVTKFINHVSWTTWCYQQDQKCLWNNLLKEIKFNLSASYFAAAECSFLCYVHQAINVVGFSQDIIKSRWQPLIFPFSAVYICIT